MKPNIFEISTKELSQDAFLTWLLMWADKSNKEFDSELNNMAKNFVVNLITKEYPTFNEEIESVKAGRQWENIDVWAEVNNKYLIIIEDKTNSEQHSDQLYRYKETAINWCNEQNPQYLSPICVYLKTGNESQSNYDKIKEKGYHIFNRTDLINLLTQSDIKNDIYKDFLLRITKIESSNNEWESKIIKDWRYNDWQGFFQFLERETDLLNRWFYVNNQSGGFWCGLMTWEYWGEFPVYMQIEQNKLCIKVSVDDIDIPDNKSISEIRNDFSKKVIQFGHKEGLTHIRKPDRFGTGNYMTIAVVDCENWLSPIEEKINKENSVNKLRTFRDFLNKIINTNNQENAV